MKACRFGAVERRIGTAQNRFPAQNRPAGTSHISSVGAGDSFMAGLMVGLTRGIDTQKVLENACRVGAFVASHNGATPLLPPEITQEFKRV